MITDLASVPRIPVIFSMWGNRCHHEATIHDLLYGTHLTSKKDADLIFLEAMKARGKPLWIREPMYLAVKLGGRSSYKTGPKRWAERNAGIACINWGREGVRGDAANLP